MKKIFLAMIAVLALSVFAPSFSLSTANAASCGTAETAINFGNCGGGGASPVAGIILWAINFLAIGVGIAVVIGIVFGGITYAMSDGDEGKAKEGRGMIINAVIGLFLFIFLWAAANFMVPGGVFN